MVKKKYETKQKEYRKGVIDAFIEYYEDKEARVRNRFLEERGRAYAPEGYRIPKELLRDTSGYYWRDNDDGF